MAETPSDPAPGRHQYSPRTLLSLRTVNTNPSFLKHQAELLGPIYRPVHISISPSPSNPSRCRYTSDPILSIRPPRLPSPVSHLPSPPNLPTSSPPLSFGTSSSPPSLPRPIPRSNFAHYPDERRFPISMSPPSEFRRRSPSPPASSPLSSSPPPGFEPTFSSKPPSKHAVKAAICREREAMYRSRICKGPDLSRNFASRLAYHGLKSEPSTSNAPPPPLRSPGRPILHRSRSPSPELPRRRDFTPEAFGAHGNLRAEQSRKTSTQAEVSRPPVVSYNISGAVSFEDFSKRLAAEVAGNDLLENKAATQLNSVIEDAPILEENPLQNEDEAGEEKEEELPQAADREAADNLSRWFGLISGGTEDELPTEQTELPFMALQEVEKQMTGINGSAEESKEELDSNVLSFFDTIRSQAMGERTEIMPQNSDVHGPLYSEGPSRGMENYFHSKYVAGETTNVRSVEEDTGQLTKSEIEETAHLFTNGKPVYKTAELEAKNHDGVPSDGAFNEQSASASAPSLVQVQRGSESLKLERWFNSLALQSELES